MSKSYESIQFRGEWKGSTFGCSCCSTDDTLDWVTALEELRNTARMYELEAERYNQMAKAAKIYNIPFYYAVYKEYLLAVARLEAARDYEENPRKCGVWKKECHDMGISTLEEQVKAAKEVVDSLPDIEQVATLFVWR